MAVPIRIVRRDSDEPLAGRLMGVLASYIHGTEMFKSSSPQQDGIGHLSTISQGELLLIGLMTNA